MNGEHILRATRWVRSGFLLQVALVFGLVGSALAQDPPSECTEMGALAYDNWTKVDSGGAGGLPDGAQSSDYVRCKACHGWDRMGIDGGYVRRSRNEGRPNAGAGDADDHHRNITREVLQSLGLTITKAMILHNGPGQGRSFEDGKGSWVELIGGFGFRDANNHADWAKGYTLGNQHPDFSTGGDNAMTQEQVDCLVEFLNSDDAQPDIYFDAIHPHLNPVLYEIVDTADPDNGQTLYNANCMACHGHPAMNHQGANDGHPDGGILAYLAQDGKFSEFAHKVRWGIPDTIMTRTATGTPTAADVADLMLYLQELGGTGFYMTPGLNGAWYAKHRDGEGFNVEVASNGQGGQVFVAYFYTYDSMGNQLWLLAQGSVQGDMAEVNVFATDGAMWGDAFDKVDVNLLPWGSGTFAVTSCGAMSFELRPNEAAQADGFTELAYDLERLTIPTNCP